MINEHARLGKRNRFRLRAHGRMRNFYDYTSIFPRIIYDPPLRDLAIKFLK